MNSFFQEKIHRISHLSELIDLENILLWCFRGVLIFIFDELRAKIYRIINLIYDE